MKKPSVIFFGSFLQYSQHVLEKLHESDLIEIVGVVTTPPRPAGRKQILTKTHVHQYADEHNIPVSTPEKLNKQSLEDFRMWNSEHRNKISNDLNSQFSIPNSNDNPNFFLVAGFGKLLPKSWLAYPTISPINIHFSLLPKYRGAMPGEWAMMMDEKETGVSLIEMSPKLDAGAIYAQAKYGMKFEDNRETLYEKLYALGADLFLDTIEKYLTYKNDPTSYLVPLSSLEREIPDNVRVLLPPKTQPQKTEHLYARLLNKDDSYVPWKLIELGMEGKSVDEIPDLTPLMQELPSKILTQSGLAEAINRMVKALYGWPGVWTKIQTDKGEKRMKIHTAEMNNQKLKLLKVQVEGKTIENY